ncbi:monoheme cytochrome C [Maribacter sp. 2210JD10-5]|uniref:monoheme cytochrome C n=1 Tax=Maribacter sp. 2210JD10-5 TaxID=3386272 RepID=UPI0039BD80EC
MKSSGLDMKKGFLWIVLLCAVVIVLFKIFPNKSEYVDVPQSKDGEGFSDPNHVENGVHVRTGLVDGDGLQETVNNCTNCHSAKLIIQNRMTAEQWHATIRWMQEKQGLWDLGENEDIIVNYLTKYYPLAKKGRRQVLTNIDWYKLEK